MSGVAAVLSLSLFLFPTGGCLMRSSNQWEAPAGRQLSQKLVVRVDQMREGDKGILGSIENHPSMAHALPNPVVLQGTVAQQPSGWTATAIRLRYPKHKMKDVKVKDRVALGVVQKDVCICTARVETHA